MRKGAHIINDPRPLSFENKSSQFPVRRMAFWRDLLETATNHKAQTYTKAKNPRIWQNAEILIIDQATLWVDFDRTRHFDRLLFRTFTSRIASQN